MATNTNLLIDDVYARLREMILANQLRAGEKLVDRDLAALMGVSRTPVRHALGRLAMTGLVEARRRRGYYVARYTPEQMSDLYEFRRILEVNSASLAARNATPEHMLEFRSVLGVLERFIESPENRVRLVELDLQVHELIARASGNASLYEASRMLMDKLRCFIWVDWLSAASVTDPVSLAAAHRDHCALIGRILERDAEGAARLMGAHIDKAREGLTTMLKERAAIRDVVALAG